MIQVVYIRYAKIHTKDFSGENESEEARDFVDYLQNHLFDGGVVIAVTASEWKRTDVGERSERLLNGTRVWVNSNQAIDPRLEEFVEREFEQPCLHCDHWCKGKCIGSNQCIQSGKPGHVHCKSRLIEEGILKRRY